MALLSAPAVAATLPAAARGYASSVVAANQAGGTVTAAACSSVLAGYQATATTAAGACSSTVTAAGGGAHS